MLQTFFSSVTAAPAKYARMFVLESITYFWNEVTQICKLDQFGLLDKMLTMIEWCRLQKLSKISQEMLQG
jgi:hypothetical protein